MDTRWMSSVRCLKDVTSLTDEIDHCSNMLSLKGREALNELSNEYSKTVPSILAILRPLLDYNDLYQKQSEVTIRLILPTYKLLELQWQNIVKSDLSSFDKDCVDVGVLQSLAKSGTLALSHYYQEIDDVHYAAAFLTPKTKKCNILMFRNQTEY
uniref:Uncharacterized protein n=1 Tax=Caenorhabditis japonica TaxID=281687 RepID=A0A8R1IVF3_CAEJA